MILSHRTIRFKTPPKAVLLARSPNEEQMAFIQQQIEQAREEGRRQGREEVMAILNAQILEQRSQFAHLQENTFRSITAAHAELCEQLRKALPLLALEVARRVLGGIELDRTIIHTVAAETLQELAPGTPDVELRLCPLDYELVRNIEREFNHIYPNLRIVSDPELRPGDCIARSHFGTIDGRLETKLQSIQEAII
ncbi:MAG: FliH/SctL family protein [Chthoniobacterales bacterium]|nr:FliH/SctL family protein [Chthoniobacterales bacterium]